MYPTLRAELARKGMTMKSIAKKIGIAESTLSLKFNGKFDFTLAEAENIKKEIGVDMPLEELFEKDVD